MICFAVISLSSVSIASLASMGTLHLLCCIGRMCVIEMKCNRVFTWHGAYFFKGIQACVLQILDTVDSFVDL